MPYTSSATTELNNYDPRVDYKLELKTRFTGSTWLEYDYVPGSLSMHWDEDVPGELSVELLNDLLDMSDESDHANRTTIGAQVRVTSTVRTGASTTETQVEFLGDIIDLKINDYTFAITAFAEDYRITNALVEITNSVGPDEVEITGSTRRAITQIDPAYGEAYGFTSTGSGDEAFNSNTSAHTEQTRRRPWSDRGTRIWKHATDTSFTNSSGNEETYELSQQHYRIDYFSGAVTILEKDPDATYYIDNIGAFKETQLGAGTHNADFARLFDVVFTYSKDKGGVGAVLGDEWGCTITAVNTGAKRFTIAGDFTYWFKDNQQIYVHSGTNQGTYTINGDSTLSGGNTLIVVDQTVVSGTAGGVITIDTGLDMPGLMPFDLGLAVDFMSDFRQRFQRNIKPIYDADSGKFWLLNVVQRSAGNEHWAMLAANSIDQSRGAGDIYTGILVTGKTARPVNLVQAADKDGRLTDISTSPSSNWFGWNGSKVEGNDTFTNLKGRIYDGNATLGLNLHDLDNPDIDDPGAGAGEDRKYGGWYEMFQIELEDGRPIRHIEVTLPGSRNPNHPGGHQGRFWPGIRLDISDDGGTTWLPMTPLINGRYAPHSEIKATEDQIPRRYGTHVRVLGAAYKHGTSNDADPSVGIAELRMYQDTDYAIRVSMSPMHPITRVVAGAGGIFGIDGDWTEEFHDGDTFTVRNSTGNDDNYTIASAGVAYDAGNDRTGIEVTGTVADATVDGELYSTTAYLLPDGTAIRRDYPDVWDRFGRIRYKQEDLGDRFNELLARYYAYIYLDEYLKLFQNCTYQTTVPDPRIKQWQTVSIVDELNGDISTLLVRRLTKTDQYTEISGTNYLAGVLP